MEEAPEGREHLISTGALAFPGFKYLHARKGKIGIIDDKFAVGPHFGATMAIKGVEYQVGAAACFGWMGAHSDFRR